MRVELFRGAEALGSLRNPWSALEKGRSESLLPPFQTWTWASAWVSCLAAEDEPWLFVMGDPPAAVLPLIRQTRAGLRRVRFLGHGLSDYLGTVPLDVPPDTMHTLGAAIARLSGEFDLLDLQGLYARPPARAALMDGLGLRWAERLYERCPVIETTGEWEQYLATRKKRFRANLRRAEKRVRSQGEVAVRREVASKALLSEMFEVERASWKWRHGNAYLFAEERRRFLEMVLLDGSARHEVWTLRLDGCMAAFAIIFTDAATRYYYLPSFRESHPDAGTWLLAEIVRESFSGSVTEFDFLAGDERYKLAWAHRERSVYQVIAAGSTPLGRAAFTAIRLRWALARSKSLQSLRASLVRLRGRSARIE